MSGAPARQVDPCANWQIYIGQRVRGNGHGHYYVSFTTRYGNYFTRVSGKANNLF